MLLKIVLTALCAVSLFTFVIYGVDKSKAKRGAWRIPERVLLLSSLLGGATGGGLAMLIFRHKTRHWYFIAVNIVGLVWQLGLVVFLAVRAML